MSPRTRLALVVGAILLTAACGEPPDAPPEAFPARSEPPFSAPPPPVVQPGVTMPTAVVTTAPTTYPTVTYPVPTYTVPGYATPPPRTATSTTAPLTKSPTPTPAHAARCTGEPTGPQILTLIKGDAGVPDKELRVAEGPFCSGAWSFTTVRIAGENKLEPLMVSATGRGAQLTLVAAGTDVCNQRMQTEAPAGIRVLACGF